MNTKHQYRVTFREDRGWLYNEKHDWHLHEEIIDAANKKKAYEKALQLAEIYSLQFPTIVYKKDVRRV